MFFLGFGDAKLPAFHHLHLLPSQSGVIGSSTLKLKCAFWEKISWLKKSKIAGFYICKRVLIILKRVEMSADKHNIQPWLFLIMS